MGTPTLVVCTVSLIPNNICTRGIEYQGSNIVSQDDNVKVFLGNMMFSIGFTIVGDIEEFIDPKLSQVVFRRPFSEITNLIVDGREGTKTFTDVSYQTPYKSWDLIDLDRDAQDKIGSQVVLSEDDVRRGCTRPLDLSCGFFKDVSKRDSKYRKNDLTLIDPKYIHFEGDT